jgi:Protein of unknown function (DUF3300)
MKPPSDLPFAPELCHSTGFQRRELFALTPKRYFARRSALLALGGLTALTATIGASRLSAQDYWPPDDPSPVAPQQQYAPQPSYPGSPQYAPQYPQSPYASNAQPYPQGYPRQDYGQPGSTQQGYGSQQTYTSEGYGQQLGPQPGQAQPVSPEQLTQLIAPIALYPDSLVAQILAASTYPAQIAAADQWLRSMGGAQPEQIAAAVDAQSSWDPSVKALTAFPQVLQWLAGNLQWTTTLGNAYYNQPQDVLQTIQVMRERAEQAGNLQSTPREEVTQDQGAIDIAPTNPQVVYVPTYNPWSVYGAPVDPYPGFSLLGAADSFFGSSAVQFGLNFAMGAFMHTPWGFLGWGLDWLAHSVLFNHSDYFTNSNSVRDWGFPHGGPRAYRGNPQFAHGGYGGYGSDRGWKRYGSTVRSGYAPRFGRPNPTYARPSENFNRYGQGFNRPQPYGDARTTEGFNRGFAPRNEFPARPALPPQMAYNRYPQPLARSPQFGSQPRPYEAPHQYAYANRPGMNYGSSPSYQNRMPSNTYRGNTSRSYDAYRGNESARSPSGGFHLFGNHNSDGFGGGRAPKSYSYSGGHSSWGGGGGWKAPKESHFGGGGSHWGGGGSHSSGGGHSSSHSGGHHH